MKRLCSKLAPPVCSKTKLQARQFWNFFKRNKKPETEQLAKRFAQQYNENFETDYEISSMSKYEQQIQQLQTEIEKAKHMVEIEANLAQTSKETLAAYAETVEEAWLGLVEAERVHLKAQSDLTFLEHQLLLSKDKQSRIPPSETESLQESVAEAKQKLLATREALHQAKKHHELVQKTYLQYNDDHVNANSHYTMAAAVYHEKKHLLELTEKEFEYFKNKWNELKQQRQQEDALAKSRTGEEKKV